jgi:hypothetical protein
MWKLTRNVLLYALGLLLVGVASLVIINGFKSEPSETSRVLAEVPANPYPDSDNLFLARSAINLPDMENRLTEARNRLVRESQWTEDLVRGRLTMEQLQAKQAEQEVIRFAKSIEWCNPAVRPCLAQISQQHGAIESSKTSNALLFKRYLELPNLSGSHNITVASPYAPVANGAFDIRLLFLNHVGDAFLQGTKVERAAALRQLSDDLGVWRKTLAGYGSLVDKMIAVHHLHQSLALIGEIINHPGFDTDRDGSVLAAALQDTAIPDMSGMWRYEYLFSHQLLETLDAQGVGHALNAEDDTAPSALRSLLNTASLWFFDRTDTQNRRADYFSKLIAASKLPASEGLSALKTLDATTNEWAPWWSYLRNPIGKTLFPYLSPYSEYNRRIYDVFAYQQLVLVSYQWRTQRLPPATLATQLPTNPLAQHPASGTPFHYDTETRTLRMEPLHPRKERRFDVAVFSPVAP